MSQGARANAPVRRVMGPWCVRLTFPGLLSLPKLVAPDRVHAAGMRREHRSAIEARGISTKMKLAR